MNGPDRIDEWLDACEAFNRAQSARGTGNSVAEQALGLMTEAAEFADASCWKPWKTSAEFDREKFLDEAADVMNFFGNMLNEFNVTADELFNAFMAKNEVNYQRMADGY